MVAVARNHHYVPQGYLAGFTNTGARDGKLYVFDLRTGSIFQTRPRNVAAERDFNRIDIDGANPDALETSLSGFEDKAVLAIRKIAQENTYYGGTDLSYVINLLCLLLYRNPRTRRSLNSGDSNGEAPRNSIIRIELSVFNEILANLGGRFWTLLIADSDAPDFITCDHPVTLVSTSAKTNGRIGIGLHQTELVFPITPRHAFIGVFENRVKQVESVTPKLVAEVNTRILLHADRQLYSRARVVSVLKDGKLTTFDSAPANPGGSEPVE
jgi:hypothetical protein